MAGAYQALQDTKSHVAPVQDWTLQDTPDPRLIAMAFAVSAAISAARLDHIEALRHE